MVRALGSHRESSLGRGIAFCEFLGPSGQRHYRKIFPPMSLAGDMRRCTAISSPLGGAIAIGKFLRPRWFLAGLRVGPHPARFLPRIAISTNPRGSV
jgi:hypothetical protein